MPCPPPGDLLDPGIEPGSPVLQADFLPLSPTDMANSPLLLVFFLLLLEFLEFSLASFDFILPHELKNWLAYFQKKICYYWEGGLF